MKSIRRKYQLIFLIISVLLVSKSTAQTNPNVEQPFDPSVISQMPERGKFPVLMENLSVDHFTGQPNIDFPIYTINAYDINVPIALKHRTGGNRVDVEDSYLGINWDLIAGGEIRRTVIGLPDDINTSMVKGYTYINQLISDYQNQNRKSFVDRLKYNEKIFSPFSLDCEMVDLAYKYGQQHSDGRFDTSPDIYNFNIMGLNGTFTIGIGGNIENLQSNEWIYMINQGSNVFKILDLKGYEYTFKEKEWHTYKYRTGYYGDFIAWKDKVIKKYDYVITWKISEIKSPTGEIVKFQYESHNNVDERMEESIYNVRSSYSNLFIPAKCLGETDKIIINSQYSLFSDFKEENVNNYIYKYLTSIVSTNTELRFNYIIENTNCPKLSVIEIYVGKINKRLLKKIELNNGNYYLNNIYSIKEYGSNSEYKEYKFSYYSNSNFTRFSSDKKDHWGFYSPNANEYASGVYNFELNSVLNYRENPSIFGNKNPRNLNANEGMLRQITYPTGGKVIFDWEFHDYSMRSVLLQKHEMTDGYFEGHEISVKDPPIISEEKRELTRNASSVSVYSNENNKKVTIDLTHYYPTSGSHIHDDCNLEGVTFCKCVLGWDGNQGYYPNEIPYVIISGPGGYSKKIDIKKSNVWKKHIITLGSKGTYNYKLVNAGKELINNTTYCYDFYTHVMTSGNFEKVGISLTTYPSEPEIIRQNTFLTGGVRIKEIIFEEEYSKIRKLYNYSLNPFDAMSPSSGVLTKAPRYGHFSSIAIESHPCDDPYLIAQFNYQYILTANAIPKSTKSSNHIEYSLVTEFTTNKIGNLSHNTLDSNENIDVISYEFWTSADDIETCDKNETLNIRHVSNNQLILTSMHFNRGHLKQKKELKNEEKTTLYRYNILEKSNVDYISGILFPIRDFSTVNPCYKFSDVCDNSAYNHLCWYKDYGIIRYKIIPYNKRLEEVEESGTLTKNYQQFKYAYSQYNNDKLANFPISESNLNSKGDTVTNYITYTELGKIHTYITVCNGYIIDALRNEYDQLGNMIHKYVAEISATSNILASGYQLGSLRINNSHPIISLANKCVETRTYENNRLCEIINHDAMMSTVYIWGYNGEFPIAEIKNFNLEKRDLLINSIQISNLFQSENPDVSTIDNLRNILDKSLITTFTYNMKMGVSSTTDPRGVTTFYTYNSFGQLKECYTLENGQKKILQKMEYQWTQ